MTGVNIWIYIIISVIILFALKFRKAMKQSATFLSSTAHAFASEYNDVYTNNEDVDGTQNENQTNETKED
jgi:hypothetical protein